MGFSLRGGLCVDQEIVCAFCTHDKAFLSVQDIMTSILLGEGRRAEEIRPAPGFGERLCTAELSFKGRLQVFRLLFRGSEVVDRFTHNAHQ